DRAAGDLQQQQHHDRGSGRFSAGFYGHHHGHLSLQARGVWSELCAGMQSYGANFGGRAMIPGKQLFVRKSGRRQRGQVLVWMAGGMLAILGLCGLALDTGRIYFSYRELQASTDAAALAGAQALPNSNAASVATTYSGVTGGKNAHANLPNVAMASGSP